MKICNFLIIFVFPIVVTGYDIERWFSAALTSNSDNLLLADPVDYRDVPINTYKVKNFRINVTIGLPPQTFNLIFLTTSSEFNVISSECNSDECNYFNDSPTNYTRNKYNAEKSLTSNNTNEQIRNILNGTYFTDMVRFGSYNFGYQKFGNYKTSNGFSAPADGILALGGEKIDGKYVSPILNALKRNVYPQRFTIALNKTPVEGNTNSDAGIVTFGDINNQLCDSNVNFVDVTSKYDFWEFQVDGFEYGKTISNRGALAWPMHHHEFSYVPQRLYAQILRETQAKPDETYGFYVVDCEKIDTLPAIKIKINNQLYEMIGRDYVAKVNIIDKKERCVFTINSSAFTKIGWILGTNFFHNYCVSFDFGESEIGFSKLIKS